MSADVDSFGRYSFTSSRFEPEPGEDEETNPRLYGRQLATWLHAKLGALGYPVEPVFGEDWGWALICQREPYELMIGCVNYRDYELAVEGDPPPVKDELLWNTVGELNDAAFRSAHPGSSVGNALMFLLVFGLPGATYAYRTRFGFRKARQLSRSAT
jgi:hypothetical protein